jgi:hypothetical protein
MIAHVVLFRPKPSIADGERRAFAQLLQQAFREIPSLSRVRVGKVAEGSHAGSLELGDTTDFFVAVLEFANEKALRDYLTHPKHEELARLFWQHNESTVILDAPMVDPKTEDIDRLLVLVGVQGSPTLKKGAGEAQRGSGVPASGGR